MKFADVILWWSWDMTIRNTQYGPIKQYELQGNHCRSGN